MMLHGARKRHFFFVMTDIGFVYETSGARRRQGQLKGRISVNAGENRMPTIVKHRKVNIVLLEQDESIGANCKPGDIAICAAADGWWTSFIGEDGAIDRYDIPYPSYKEALWAAKAAAEFGV